MGVVFERGKLTNAMTKEMICKVFSKLLERYWSYFVTAMFRCVPGFLLVTLFQGAETRGNTAQRGPKEA